MLPSLSLTSSPNSATVRIDKATSEFLLGPVWRMNMEIFDSVNSDHWIAKEAVKQVKKRLQRKNPWVQLLSLTLLETMVKNCGDHIHFHIAERRVLDEMIKLVKKRGDMQTRDKILMLLDHWQQAFGGPGGKHSQYYWAYDELRRSGVQFPRRSLDSPPIITPPATQPPASQPPLGLGMLGNASRRLDETVAYEIEGLSLSTMESMRNVMELLVDMLQAVNPTDCLVVKDEVIVDLVDRCRINQKKLMQMLTTTVDEVLLAQGLELNDALQGVLAKHDAIASGSLLPTHMSKNESTATSSNLKNGTAREDSRSTLNASSSLPSSQAAKGQVVEEEEEDDEFAQLARRHTKPGFFPAKAVSVPANEDNATSSDSCGPTYCASDASVSSLSNALVLSDPPAPVKAMTGTTKEQDMVDLLSIVLSTSSTSEEARQTPNSAPSQSYSSGNNVQPTLSTYVAPWAKPESQPHPQPQPKLPFYLQTHIQQQILPQSQPQQPSYHNYSYGYPPPPWAATPGYLNGHITATDHYGYANIDETNHSTFMDQGFRSYPFQTPRESGNQQLHSNDQETMNATSATGIRSLRRSTSSQDPQSSVYQNGHSTSQATMNSPSANQVGGVQPLQSMGSLPFRGYGGFVAMNGEVGRISNTAPSAAPMGQKPFVPSYRLFEDLNVFGNSEGKIRSGPYPSASGSSSQNMVGGRG